MAAENNFFSKIPTQKWSIFEKKTLQLLYWKYHQSHLTIAGLSIGLEVEGH